MSGGKGPDTADLSRVRAFWEGGEEGWWLFVLFCFVLGNGVPGSGLNISRIWMREDTYKIVSSV